MKPLSQNDRIPAALPVRHELWQRVEVHNGDTGFRWMVWVDEGSDPSGSCNWFQTEDEARTLLGKFEQLAEEASRGD